MTRSLTRKTGDPNPLRQVLMSESRAEERPSEQTINAAMAVREVARDVVASCCPHLSADDYTNIADELVKAVRAKPTRWAFAYLATHDT